jgi:hypothetical protein
MDSTSSQGISYKTHVLIGCTASGNMTVIYHWPHVPRQEVVQQKIDAESSTYAIYLLCTPTSIMPVVNDGRPRLRSSGRLGFR